MPSAFGKRPTKSIVSTAGLEPSTGVPTISMSKSSTTDGSEEVMSKAGAFVDSEIVSAMRFVFPVLEKYNTHGFVVSEYDSFA